MSKKEKLWDYLQRRNKELKKLTPLEIKKEYISTHVDDWDEFSIESPLITKESIMVLLPFLKKEIPEIKHCIYTSNFLIRLYFDDNILMINSTDIALHVDTGILKILQFSTKEEDILKILNFFLNKFNEAIKEIENEKKETHAHFLKRISEMKLNFVEEE